MKKQFRSAVGATALSVAAAVFAASAADPPASPEEVESAAPISSPQAAVLQAVFTAQVPAPDGSDPTENQLIFTASDGDGRAYFDALLERLNDPQQRQALRAEQRRSIADGHPDVGQFVGLDEAAEQKLIDLLTEQQMQSLAASYRQASGGPSTYIDAEQARLDALRALLGEDKFERYLDYKTTLYERMQIGAFDARLAADQKLTAQQKERLLPLFYEATRRQAHHAATSARSFGLGYSSGPLDQEQLRRHLLMDSLRSNERQLLRLQEANDWLAPRAAAILTQPQQAVLAQVHASNVAALKRWGEHARLQAGLDPSAPAEPAAAEPKRVSGRIKLDLALTVNAGEPTKLERVLANGGTATFATREGLWVEATPTLYEDDFLDLHLEYYEQTRNGRRRIGGGSRLSKQSRTLEGIVHGGADTTMIAGRRAYALSAEATAEPL